MLSLILAATQSGSGAVPPSTLPVASGSSGTGTTIGPGIGEVIRTVFENLSDNGYQTGVALVVATIAVVAMLNLGVHKAVLVPVSIGAFWAGWLGWNTFSGQDNALFPGDLSATKLWDVATTSDKGFLAVVIVGCVAAVFLWRKGTAFPSRVALLFGAVLGASFLYNLVEALRYS
jgi:hypothetical protein